MDLTNSQFLGAVKTGTDMKSLASAMNWHSKLSGDAMHHDDTMVDHILAVKAVQKGQDCGHGCQISDKQEHTDWHNKTASTASKKSADVRRAAANVHDTQIKNHPLYPKSYEDWAGLAQHPNIGVQAYVANSDAAPEEARKLASMLSQGKAYKDV